MGWVRFDNGIGSHRRALELEEDLYLPALGLLLVAVGYCDQHRTDGYLPAKALPRIAYGDVNTVAADLVRVGFFEVAEGGYRVHDYLEWQRSSAEIDAAIEKARKAGRARQASYKLSTELSGGHSRQDKTDETDDTYQTHAQCDETPPRRVTSEEVQDLQTICHSLTPPVCEELIAEFGFDLALEATRRVKMKASQGERVNSWPSLVRGIAKNLRNDDWCP